MFHIISPIVILSIIFSTLGIAQNLSIAQAKEGAVAAAICFCNSADSISKAYHGISVIQGSDSLTPLARKQALNIAKDKASSACEFKSRCFSNAKLIPKPTCDTNNFDVLPATTFASYAVVGRAKSISQNKQPVVTFGWQALWPTDSGLMQAVLQSAEKTAFAKLVRAVGATRAKNSKRFSFIGTERLDAIICRSKVNNQEPRDPNVIILPCELRPVIKLVPGSNYIFDCPD